MNPILDNLPLVTIFGFFTFSAIGWFVQDDPMRMSLFGIVGAAMSYGLGRLLGRISDEIMPLVSKEPQSESTDSGANPAGPADQGNPNWPGTQQTPQQPGTDPAVGMPNPGQAGWRENQPDQADAADRPAGAGGGELDLSNLPGGQTAPGQDAGPATATAEPKKATVKEDAANNAPFPMGEEPSGE